MLVDMKRLATLACATFTLSLLLAPAAFAQADDPVVLTIGEEQITRSQFELILSTLTDQQRAQIQTPEARKQLAQQIVELKVMAQEGRRRRLDQDPVVQMDVIMQAERILAREAFEQILSEPADDATLQAYYDEHKEEYEQATGSHILIRFEGSPVPIREGTEERTDIEALQMITEIREKLLAGADFGETAQAESDDRGSAENGGDLGVFRRGEMIEEFTDTSFTIPLNEVSAPIKTDYGYHLIVIRDRGYIPFEDVKDELQQQLLQQIGTLKVQELKDATNVVYDPAYFGGVAATDPFAPPALDQ